ncbi:transglycosylase domain-containing protein [Candidatus Peregrinibacteria bacterium]|nr:transglycosylase domain-containing protein [Candidatus Peregrinibacteria bacterium]
MLKVARIFIGLIILILVSVHLIAFTLFICPVPKILDFAVGKQIDYVYLTQIPDYINQVFSYKNDDFDTDLFVSEEYFSDNRSQFINMGNLMAQKILILRYNKFFDSNQRQELYLNTLDFGGDVIGISAASNYYFQKQPSELSLEEVLTLSGIYKIFDN